MSFYDDHQTSLNIIYAFPSKSASHLRMA